MPKWVKEAFSKKLIFGVYIPGIILFILDRAIPEFSIINIIVDIAMPFLFKILILGVPIWLLLLVVIVSFVLFKIKRRALDEKQKFILAIIVKREVNLTDLAFAYKKRWKENNRLKTKCFKILSKLERLKLVELGCHVGGVNTVQEEMFRATDKGKKRLEKIHDSIKNKAEEINEEVWREVCGLELIDAEIEENKRDIVFILGFLANRTDKRARQSTLRGKYFNEFSDKEIADFNYVWSVLERRRLVEQEGGTTGYGESYSELSFYITANGLKLYNENKDALED